LVFLAAGLLTLATAKAQAQVKVIANPSVSADAISADDLKSIFLEDSDSLKGAHVQPVLEKGGAAHEQFLKLYLNKSESALQTYYRSLVFTGKGSMPKTVGSDAEVEAYVAKTKGAIGYVAALTGNDDVKTLSVK
jgi:ABC-type phosphate transport system substrate-binding protein